MKHDKNLSHITNYKLGMYRQETRKFIKDIIKANLFQTFKKNIWNWLKNHGVFKTYKWFKLHANEGLDFFEISDFPENIGGIWY